MGRAEEKARAILGAKGEPKGSPARSRGGRPKVYRSEKERQHAKYLRRKERLSGRSEAFPLGKSIATGEEASQGPSEADVKAYAFLGATVWRLAGPMLHLRPLTEEESLHLGGAIAPVAVKYGNVLGPYAPEFTLVVTVAGLYLTTRENQPQPGEDVKADGG